jgi:hypothetical protein
MSNLRHISKLAIAAPLERATAVGRWRFWTALLTLFAFVTLVATAATHHHASAVEDQECAVCGVVAHKIGDVPLVKLPAATLVLLAFAPHLPMAQAIIPVSPRTLPPSCGPPAASPIC